MVEFEVSIVIINEFGEFRGMTRVLNEEDYQGLCNMAKLFYNSGGFELTTEDNTLIIFPPIIVQKSILKIERNEVENKENKEKDYEL